ncbi:MAG: Aldo/keto reductase [Acetothermia bacterium 64_32]|nr:MAG: Aldo/keto reductase [Acetothermia bacterium 64_32]
MELLFEYGVNHIDTAADYGRSEELIARWMGRHREDFFLATKTSERTYEGAKESIQRSLERLRTDRVDLIQLHNLVDEGEWERAFAPGGALEALIEAKEKGLARFIGVTDHGLSAPRMHLRSLSRYDFDSVLLPYNFPLMQLPDYAQEFEKLYRECTKRGIAVQAIKTVAKRNYPEKQLYNTWYEPLTEKEDIIKAVHWALACPKVFLPSVGDLSLLPKFLSAAADFDPERVPTDEEMEGMMRKRGMAPIFPSPPGI